MRFSTLSKPFAGALVTLLVSGVASAQVCPADDAFEPNDDCATATPITVGATGPCAMAAGTNTSYVGDFYSISVANGDVVTFDVLFLHANGDIDLRLFDDAACTNQIAGAGSVSDNENMSWTNTTGSPVTVTMEVFPWNVPVCNDYSINVTSAPGPCSGTVDDASEPNDDCSQAIARTPGTYTDLVVFKTTSDDFWTINVPDGGNLIVDILCSVAGGQDVDCYLYDSSTVGTTCGDKAAYLVRGFTSTDNEQMLWTNSTGSAQTYYIQVNVWDNASVLDCGDYDMMLTVNSPSIATVMCVGDGTDGACPCGNESTLGAGEGCKNSLGAGSILTAAGSTSVAADDISFTVTQARATQPGLLVQGSTVIGTAFKDGFFCMGNPTERVEVVFTDGSGTGTTAGSVVTNGLITPGVTRWYQMWNRDPGGVSPCGTGSNFSNGLEVTYTP